MIGIISFYDVIDKSICLIQFCFFLADRKDDWTIIFNCDTALDNQWTLLLTLDCKFLKSLILLLIECTWWHWMEMKNSNTEFRLWRFPVCNTCIDYSATSILQWSLSKWGWWICYFPEKWWEYSYSVAMLPVELYGVLMAADRSFPIVILRIIRQLIIAATVTR
jgi:hypothetical protein